MTWKQDQFEFGPRRPRRGSGRMESGGPTEGRDEDAPKPAASEAEDHPTTIEPVAPVAPVVERPLSVAELSRRIREILELSFPSASVVGQVSNLSRPQSGHLYFSLVDDGGGGRMTSAQLPVVVWKSTASRLRWRLENGQRVVVRGRIAVYEPRGAYQVVADRVSPDGVGELQLAFEELRRRLSEEGLFAPERKRPLPFFPRRIGVVTSPSGAALRDFLRVLHDRDPGVHVRIIGVRVQGEGASGEIARAIERLGDADRGGVELVVVTRGGGSLEDLWAFNEEPVARALAACPVPTVSAIGHEVDFSISDFVADLRAATPTAAAALVVPEREELRAQVSDLRQRLAAGLRRVARDGEMRLARLANASVLRFPLRVAEERQERVDRLREALENALYRRFERWDDSRIRLLGRLDSLSPLAVLARGYSVTLREDGAAVRSTADLNEGDRVELRFASGSARARIERVSAPESSAGASPSKDES